MSNEQITGYTSAADIPSPYSSITLPKLRTAAGDPIRVRFRKLDAADLALARAQFPGAFPKPRTDAEKKAALERAKNRTPAEEAKAIRDFKTMACAVIVAGCVEPRFCMGLEPADGAAPVGALGDEDQSALWEAIMRHSDMMPDEEGEETKDKSEGSGSATAAALGDFHGERPEGSEPR